ncbi:hypothetical protein BLNAU_6758 [Blattamonas nauphoetae]|uniref:Cilia-and flagella-associated protein 96 n=1 Tax=Blattamonas nauphoetae TaxID=2049346 RepID=A0ABQ9Y3F1_9EUKA|nr:hypothetical protein BLNAU_6758 [Blattamonas nauphoetae]
MTSKADSLDGTHTLKMFDVFSQTSSISVGEPYQPPATIQFGGDRYKGRQFVTNPPKKGTGNEAMFGKFTSLASTDVSQTKSSPNKLNSTQSSIQQPPFRVTPPTKGPYHVFSAPEYMPEPLDDKKAIQSKIKTQEKPNIRVSATKTFKYDTFGKFSYMSPATTTVTVRSVSPIQQPPFRAMMKTGNTFHNDVYSSVNMKPSSTATQTIRSRSVSPTPFKAGTKWHGADKGTFNKYPSYIPELSLPEKKKKPEPKRVATAFKPAGTTRVSVPCPSIATMNAKP